MSAHEPGEVTRLGETEGVTSPTPTGEIRVRVEAIRVEGRHRKDFGDVEALAKDIQENGLIHPLALTADNRLIAGERRLRAVRLLGWTTVPVRYMTNIDDAASILRAERSENTQRKDMLPSEVASLGIALEELERPKAAARQAHGATAPGRTNASGTDTRSASSTSADVVADAMGVSASTYKRARAVHKAASDETLPEPERARAQKAMDEMDRTETVTPVYNQWKAGATFDAKPEPAANGKPARPRKPLTDAFFTAANDLMKLAERVDRLSRDDRFPKNAEQVARTSRHDLLRAADLLATVIERLPTPAKEITQ